MTYWLQRYADAGSPKPKGLTDRTAMLLAGFELAKTPLLGGQGISVWRETHARNCLARKPERAR